MWHFLIGLALIAFAAVVGFYGTQLAREGWTKMSSPVTEVSNTTPEGPKTTPKNNTNLTTTNQSGGQNIIAGRDVNLAPSKVPTFSEKVETYVFSFGGSGMIVPVSADELRQAPRTPFTFGNVHPITVYLENDTLMVDITWPTGVQGADIKLHKNVLSGRPHGWEMNSNDRALEVTDNTGQPVFQFIKKNESHKWYVLTSRRWLDDCKRRRLHAEN